jgi:hypothetical protein
MRYNGGGKARKQNALLSELLPYWNTSRLTCMVCSSIELRHSVLSLFQQVALLHLINSGDAVTSCNKSSYGKYCAGDNHCVTGNYDNQHEQLHLKPGGAYEP